MMMMVVGMIVLVCVMILGVGVVGLQVIVIVKWFGVIVSVMDVCFVVKEQVESLGVNFV